jgi:F-type H+-transporting ATPase subunit b
LSGFTTPIFLAAAPNSRVFGLDSQTLVDISLMLLNAAVLAAVLSFLLYRPVRNYLRARVNRIKAQMDIARSDMEKADALLAKYDGRLADIDGERREILDAANRRAAEDAKAILAEAKREADAIRERARSDVEREREKAADLLKLYIIEASSAMAEKLVAGAASDKGAQDALFEAALKDLEESDWPI